MSNNKGKKNLVFIDALTDALGRSEGQSVEEITDELREEGIDVETTLQRLLVKREDISRAAKRQRLERAKKERLRMESERPGFLERISGWTKEQILATIQELTTSSDEAVTVSFRDLESKSREDLVALLEDFELAKQRETYDKEENE